MRFKVFMFLTAIGLRSLIPLDTALAMNIRIENTGQGPVNWEGTDTHWSLQGPARSYDEEIPSCGRLTWQSFQQDFSARLEKEKLKFQNNMNADGKRADLDLIALRVDKKQYWTPRQSALGQYLERFGENVLITAQQQNLNCASATKSDRRKK